MLTPSKDNSYPYLICMMFLISIFFYIAILGTLKDNNIIEFKTFCELTNFTTCMHAHGVK